MLNLILNENMKIYRRPRTWLLIAALFILMFIHAFSYHSSVSEQQANANWQQELTERNEELREYMEKYKTDMSKPDIDSINARIMKNEYYIEHDMAPGEMTQWEYLTEVTEVLLFAGILTAIIASDIVASEFSGGTIKLLLIRPVSRTKILLAKYLSMLLFGGVMTVLLLAVGYLLGGVLFGFGGMDLPYIYVSPEDNAIHQMTTLDNVLFSVGLQLLGMLIIVTLAFMISAAMRSSALAIAVSLVAMFVGTGIVGFFLEYGHSWVKYILFANMDLRMYLEGPILVEGMTMGFSLTVIAVYFVVFHLLAWLFFTKRDVAA